MPIVPQPDANGVVRSLGFSFNFSNAFATTAQAQGVPVNTSFSNLQASLGTSNDLFPTQKTAWGRGNQANILGGQAYNLANLAFDSAATANSNMTALTTANAVGKVGTALDTPSLTTSLWAYAKRAEDIADSNLGTLTTLLTPNGIGVVGRSADIPSLTTSLWAYAKQTNSNATLTETSLSNLTTANAVGQVGTVLDNPSLTTSLWAYAKKSITVASQAKNYTLLGATAGGVITNERGIGTPGGVWTQDTFLLATTIRINVPPGWEAGQSVIFDGYSYYNFDAAVSSYWAVFYITNTQPVEQSLIGNKDTNDSIYSGTGLGQFYLPLNLTIPPLNLTSSGTITIRVYGRLTTANHYLVSNPLIDGRVGLAFP